MVFDFLLRQLIHNPLCLFLYLCCICQIVFNLLVHGHIQWARIMLYNLARAEGRYKVACLWTVVVHLFAELLIEIHIDYRPYKISTKASIRER